VRPITKQGIPTDAPALYESEDVSVEVGVTALGEDYEIPNVSVEAGVEASPADYEIPNVSAEIGTRDVDSAWTPEDIATLVWLDAADDSTITEVGGFVSQWDDKSGNGLHAVQPAGASQPRIDTKTISGLPVMDFDLQGMFMTIAGTGTDNWREVYVACRFDPSATFTTFNGLFGSTIVGGPANGVGFLGRSGTTELFTPFWFDDIRLNGDVIGAPYNVLPDLNESGLLFGTTNSDVSIDGATIGNDRSITATRSWRSPICEIVVLDYQADQETREKIEGYLAHKWNFDDKLDASHPYKSVRAEAKIPFQPNFISPAHWFDASNQSAVLQVGGFVSRWRNRASTGFDPIQTSSPLQPTINTSTLNGMPVMDFSAADNKRIGPNTLSTDFYNHQDMYFVCQRDETTFAKLSALGSARFTTAGQTGSGIGLLGDNAGAGTDLFSSTKWWDNVYLNGEVLNAPYTVLPTLNNWGIISASADNPVIVAGLWISNDRSAGDRGWKGRMAEVLIFDRKLPDDERQLVEGYLAHKWNLTGILPVGHPYKVDPPTWYPDE